MKHHYNKEELIELKRKYDMQVRKEAIEEIKHTIDLDREIEELKNENEKLTKEWLKSQEKRRKAIEYATKRQEWLMNCNYSKIGTHNYINFALEIIDILKGSDKE